MTAHASVAAADAIDPVKMWRPGPLVGEQNRAGTVREDFVVSELVALIDNALLLLGNARLAKEMALEDFD
eukprot:scaffold99932_cov28-Tisochrysis_lutea.AAC.2